MHQQRSAVLGQQLLPEGAPVGRADDEAGDAFAGVGKGLDRYECHRMAAVDERTVPPGDERTAESWEQPHRQILEVQLGGSRQVGDGSVPHAHRWSAHGVIVMSWRGTIVEKGNAG